MTTTRRKLLARWYAAASRRRGELLTKKYRGGGLTAAEAVELADLRERCRAEVVRVRLWLTNKLDAWEAEARRKGAKP